MGAVFGDLPPGFGGLWRKVSVGKGRRDLSFLQRASDCLRLGIRLHRCILPFCHFAILVFPDSKFCATYLSLLEHALVQGCGLIHYLLECNLHRHSKYTSLKASAYWKTI